MTWRPKSRHLDLVFDESELAQYLSHLTRLSLSDWGFFSILCKGKYQLAQLPHKLVPYPRTLVPQIVLFFLPLIAFTSVGAGEALPVFLPDI